MWGRPAPTPTQEARMPKSPKFGAAFQRGAHSHRIGQSGGSGFNAGRHKKGSGGASAKVVIALAGMFLALPVALVTSVVWMVSQ